jgi:hypothetical protein
MEFNDKKIVKKILDTPNVRLQGANLVLSKATRHLVSLLSLNDNNDETDDDEEVQTIIVSKTAIPESILTPLQPQNQSPLFVLPSPYQESSQQQSFIIPTSSPIVIEPILIPSPE